MEQQPASAVTEVSDNYEECQRTCGTHLCGCGGRLVTAWDGAAECFFVRCVKDDGRKSVEATMHSGWQAVQSLTQMYRRGEALPINLANQAERVVGKLDLARMNATLAIRLAQDKFHDLKGDRDGTALFLAQAAQIGLNPLLGECVPLVFNKNDRQKRQVSFFVNRNGWGVLAGREQPDMWDGGPNLLRITDPVKKQEYGFDATDFVVEAAGRLKGDPPGMGRVLRSAYTEADRLEAKAHRQAYAENHPWEMAEARAERRWYQLFYRAAMGLAQRVQAATLENVDAQGIEGFTQILEGEWHPPAGEGGGTAPPASEAWASLTGEKKVPASREQVQALEELARGANLDLDDMLKRRGVDRGRMTVGQVQAIAHWIQSGGT